MVNNLQPGFSLAERPLLGVFQRPHGTLTQRTIGDLYRQLFRHPKKVSYERAVAHQIVSLSSEWVQYPSVVPNWDNTPRSGVNGIVFHNSTPELFRRHLRHAMGQVAHREFDRRVIVVKSWNEWAEGNYLEPDLRFGRSYLQVVKDEVLGRNELAANRAVEPCPAGEKTNNSRRPRKGQDAPGPGPGGQGS